MGKNDAVLHSITPFKEDERWYLKLVYAYKDKKGKHMVVIPKASVPFVQGSVPYINSQIPYFPNSQYALEHPYISCSDAMTLYDGVSHIASERGVKTPACYFDIITEYASREMTLDEIEKELGYKVKIINKEKDDGNGKEM